MLEWVRDGNIYERSSFRLATDPSVPDHPNLTASWRMISASLISPGAPRHVVLRVKGGHRRRAVIAWHLPVSIKNWR